MKNIYYYTMKKINVKKILSRHLNARDAWNHTLNQDAFKKWRKLFKDGKAEKR